MPESSAAGVLVRAIPALEVYATTELDVVDAYLVAVVEQRKQATMVSFDKGCDRLPGITREEP